MPSKEMPSLKELFSQSWNTLKSSFGSIFILALFGSIIGFALMVVSIISIIGISFLSIIGGVSDKTSVLNQLETFLTPARLMQLGIAVMVLILVSWVISTVVRLAIIYAVGHNSEKPSLGSCISRGFSLLIPMMIIGSVTTLIIFGSSFLLIIPAIIIGLFFHFVSYEIVLGGKKWFAAIRGSVQIMSQHFGDVLIRIFIFALAVYAVVNLPIFLIQMVVKGFSASAPGEATMILFILGVIRFICNILSTFYGVVYSVITYQHAKQATDENLTPSLTWIWVVSALGWVIAILIGFQVSNMIKSPMVQEQIKKISESAKSSVAPQQTEQEKIAAWKNSISADAKPYYDQSETYFKQMGEQANDPTAVKKINDLNIASLKKAIEIDGQNPELWKSLASAYTWVNTKGTLQDALDASKKSEDLDSSLWSYAYSTGSILMTMEKYDQAILKFQQVIRMEDNYGMAHISLGVAYKQTGMKDSAKDELQKGIDILTKYNDKGDLDTNILYAKKELETIDQAVVKNTTSPTSKPVASCLNYPIREGEFASNKCYAKKDYDDLLYYLDRYNSAASSYNGAAASSNITCNGSDFFKAQCEENKRTMASAQTQIDSYKATIKSIIAKGK